MTRRDDLGKSLREGGSWCLRGSASGPGRAALVSVWRSMAAAAGDTRPLPRPALRTKGPHILLLKRGRPMKAAAMRLRALHTRVAKATVRRVLHIRVRAAPNSI